MENYVLIYKELRVLVSIGMFVGGPDCPVKDGEVAGIVEWHAALTSSRPFAGFYE